MNTQRLSQKLRRFRRATEAVSALEYAILVGVISIAVVAALSAFGTDIAEAIGNIGAGFNPDSGDGNLKKAIKE